MNSYEKGTKIWIQTTFTDSDGNATDPDTVTFTIVDPDLDTTVYSKANLTNPSTGVYKRLVELTQMGVWRFHFVGATSSPESAHASTTKVYCVDSLAGTSPEEADEISAPENTVIFDINWRSDTGTVIDQDGNTITIPAHSVVTHVTIVTHTAWDTITSFQLGKSGDSDWLVTNDQHNLTGAAPSTTIVNADEVTLTNVDLLMSFDQGAASRGSGYVVIEYINYA